MAGRCGPAVNGVNGMAKRLSIFSVCLALLSGLAGLLASAHAQQPQAEQQAPSQPVAPNQQEKRIALVIGNGAYAKSPLATAANDAGLIAQTLQAAGFDVVGARDLDGETLRRSFRDFMQKAESSGPDTVAIVYLAGYGIQLAGENYFIPVDSAINRDTDIPVEGLRISDYLRQLSALPLKAGVVVLDAARQQPFIESQSIASGLALVEPGPHLLIAFNAAPGTVAPVEQGSYGAYAQSLAEMIRTGGLPLSEVFNRVRLRVNETTKGAQVPWDSQKIETSFVFFDRAPDAPAPAPDQAVALRNKPIRELSVQDAYAAALDHDTIQGYEDFLGTYPSDPLSKRVRAIVAARREALTWLRTYRTDTPEAYWSYLRRYPRGPHAADARRRLAILTAPIEPPPTFAVIDYDIPPPPPDEIVYVDRPVFMFSEFDFDPPPPPPVYFLPPPPPDFIVLAPPPPPIGIFILPQPIFVPIPVYVRPPIYVRPPPNNIIFANIHNATVINSVINRPPQVPPRGPAGEPGNPGRPNFGGGGIGSATPALPPAVAQRATLIQQGKAPMPPSASINPADRRGRPGGPTGPLPANGTPGGPGSTLPSTLPRPNALPVPGAKGAPPSPMGRDRVPPGAPNSGATVQPGAPKPTLQDRKLPGQPVPNAGTSGPGAAPIGADRSRQIGRTPPVLNESTRPSIAPKPSAPPRPSIESERRPSFRAPPSSQPTEPPRQMAPSRPAPQVARPTPPPPRQFERPTPPPRMAAPPPPRVSAPPPPRMAAPPPRPAPQMQMMRPAAPPPPPRPAGPPPGGGGGHKCPPNVPRC